MGIWVSPYHLTAALFSQALGGLIPEIQLHREGHTTALYGSWGCRSFKWAPTSQCQTHIGFYNLLHMQCMVSCMSLYHITAALVDQAFESSTSSNLDFWSPLDRQTKALCGSWGCWPILVDSHIIVKHVWCCTYAYAVHGHICESLQDYSCSRQPSSWWFSRNPVTSQRTYHSIVW